MGKFKVKISNIKPNILNIKINKEKSSIQMCMLRRHKPPKLDNPVLFVTKRKVLK